MLSLLPSRKICQSIMNVPNGVFKGDTDRFNGVIINSQKEQIKNEDFVKKLEESLNFWNENKKRGIWFKVHLSDANWIPELAKRGFNFHHAKKTYVMMFKWLPKQENENVPPFAHTMIGVGGIVINSKKEILVVNEKNALIPNSWKLPGGYVEPNEDLIDAVMREIREETGIETKFLSLVSLRHSHESGFDCSQMYIVFGLEPISHNLVRCQREIAAVKWMPVSEYLICPQVHETNKKVVEHFLNNSKEGLRMFCETRTHEILKIKYNLYYLQKALN